MGQDSDEEEKNKRDAIRETSTFDIAYSTMAVNNDSITMG